MSSPTPSPADPRASRAIDQLCDRFEAACRAGAVPDLEAFVASVEPALRSSLLVELVPLDYEYRKDRGAAPSVESYFERFPQEREALSSHFGRLAITDTLPGQDTQTLAVDERPPAILAREKERGAEGQASGETKPTRFGNYELLEEVARGGMGVVYRARQTGLDRVVAIKVVLPGLAGGSLLVDRFLAEARLAARLRHPGIVSIHDVGEVDGQRYFSMEFVEGRTLGQLVAERRVNVRQAAAYARDMALAIQHAHDQGVLHRDLKPSNVMIDQDGRVKVMDFGLAKLVEGSSELTHQGDVLGTPSYMPPEQASGDWERVDRRSDVYSIGAVLYQLLTGKAPHVGQNPLATLTRVLSESPASPRSLNAEVDGDLEAIVMKSMAREPLSRYASARELAAELDQYLMTRRPETASARIRSRSGQPPNVLRWVMAGGVAALVLCGVVLLIKGRDGRVKQRVELEPGDSLEVVEQSASGKSPPNAEQGHDAIAASGERGTGKAKGDRVANARLGGVPQVPVDPLPKYEAGQPFNRMALVEAPERLAGVDCWTWETVGHRAGVTDGAYRADGREIATVSWDGTIRVWDASAGKLVRLFVAPTSIDAVAWSPEGGLIATAGTDEKLRFWGADSGRLLWTLPLTCGRARRMAWSLDGSRLAVGGERSVSLWNTREMTLVVDFKSITQPTNLLAWSTDGARVAAFDGKVIHLCDARAGVVVRTIETGPVTTLAWLPEPLGLVTAAPDRAVKSWSLTEGVGAPKYGLFDEPVVYIAAIQDQRQVLLGLAGGGAQVRDLETGAIARTTPSPEPIPDALGWSGGWWSARTIWAPAGGTAVDLSDAGHVGFRTPRGGRRIVQRAGTGKAGPIAWSSRGALAQLPQFGEWSFLCGWRLSQANFYSTDAATKKAGDPSHVNGTGLAWSPDGTRLASGGGDPQLCLWDESFRFQKVWSMGDNSQRTICFSRDGTRMAVGTVHSFARLLDVAADAKAKVDAFETGLAPRFAWSPSDERLVCASGDTMTFRDLVNGKAIETHAVDGAGEPLRRVESIDWSRDGRWIAVGGEKLNLYDVANRRFIMKLNIPGFVHSLKFSSDSAQLLAATGTMGTLYDVATGEIRQQWDCGAAVTSAEWGPGDRFAALNADRVRIVDTSTGERRFALLPISNVEGGIVAPSGHWRRTTSDGAPIVYVAQIPEGQQTMSAAEFSRRFGWKNDPDRVPLLTP